MSARRWWIACAAVFAGSLVALVPTTGDFGLTYDEPAYRYSQMVSQQWWDGLAASRSWSEAQEYLSPDALLYYWQYGRHGINFHPPLAGQMNLLTYRLFGGIMKDIPARRMATVIEFALVLTILFGFLASRYSACVGIVATGSLLTMPRLYGQAHLIDTDIPGLLLWTSTAIAFWKGTHEPNARRWRVLVGVLLGLAFVQKMSAVIVLLPILGWLLVTRRPRTRADWIDGIVTTIALLVPLTIAYLEIRRLTALLPPPQQTNLAIHRPPSTIPGAILLVPAGIWIVRRLLAKLFRTSSIWGAERPALEVWTAILAFAPAVGWLGNPAWWREALPRLAHYYMLSTARRGALPDIKILYHGQIYEYSLPWHNAWVLLAITVPVSILAAGVVGICLKLPRMRSDAIPAFFLLNLVTLPILRMLETPAHDGVRLFLPTFFFLAAFAGWGAIGLADGISMLLRRRRTTPPYPDPQANEGSEQSNPGSRLRPRLLVALLVLVPSAWALVRVHPYELSYYNPMIGGPRGAWNAGFELTYWYDAFDPRSLERINAALQENASITFPDENSAPSTFQELQSLGALRGDVNLGIAPRSGFPFMWLLTHDSKAAPFTRLLFVMKPFLESRPRQLGGSRVWEIASPEGGSRALALYLLTDAKALPRGARPNAPGWVQKYLPVLARFWGDGVTKIAPLSVNEPIFDWAAADPGSLRAAIRVIVNQEPETDDSRRLDALLARHPERYAALLRGRPQALTEAVDILIAHPDAIRRVLLRSAYTDPLTIGGDLDRD
jgi:4-amino-4-deoxy-L-arabinose transferase-like glycosyltransferase